VSLVANSDNRRYTRKCCCLLHKDSLLRFSKTFECVLRQSRSWDAATWLGRLDVRRVHRQMDSVVALSAILLNGGTRGGVG